MKNYFFNEYQKWYVPQFFDEAQLVDLKDVKAGDIYSTAYGCERNVGCWCFLEAGFESDGFSRVNVYQKAFHINEGHKYLFTSRGSSAFEESGIIRDDMTIMAVKDMWHSDYLEHVGSHKIKVVGKMVKEEE